MLSVSSFACLAKLWVRRVLVCVGQCVRHRARKRSFLFGYECSTIGADSLYRGGEELGGEEKEGV